MTKRWGFSWRRGSEASISLMERGLDARAFSVGFSMGASTALRDAGAFSLPADWKSSFLMGESLILRFSREEAA